MKKRNNYFQSNFFHIPVPFLAQAKIQPYHSSSVVLGVAGNTSENEELEEGMDEDLGEVGRWIGQRAGQII